MLIILWLCLATITTPYWLLTKMSRDSINSRVYHSSLFSALFLLFFVNVSMSSAPAMADLLERYEPPIMLFHLRKDKRRIRRASPSELER